MLWALLVLTTPCQTTTLDLSLSIVLSDLRAAPPLAVHEFKGREGILSPVRLQDPVGAQ